LVEPGGELCQLGVESVEVGVCSQESLLADVICLFRRADQGIDEIEYTPLVPLYERCEGVTVSSKDEGYEFLVRHLPDNRGTSVCW
jgi:hypothetical protein